MAVFLQEFPSLQSTVKPLLLSPDTVIQHGEQPHFPALEPDELVRVIDTSVPVQTAEITPILFVLRMFKPERQDRIHQFILILLRQLLKINHDNLFYR